MSPVNEQQSGGNRQQSENSTVTDQASTSLSPGWTQEDTLALAEKVYELLKQDLMLELERGAW